MKPAPMAKYLIRETNASVLPCMNSRVLNEPPVMPIDFCATCGCRMPVADCRFDFGLSRAVAHDETMRTAAATTVTRERPAGRRLHQRRAPASQASAVNSTSPEDRPISV